MTFEELEGLFKKYAPGAAGLALHPGTATLATGINSAGIIAFTEHLRSELGAEINENIFYKAPTLRDVLDLVNGCGKTNANGDAASDDARRDTRAAVEIVGMACRLPGCGSVGEFWDLLASRKTLETVRAEKKTGGDLLKDIAFDAAFFGISPREATHMDPQQKLLLQVVWHSLEDACLSRADLSGRCVGVFIGAASYENSMEQMRRGTPLGILDVMGNAGALLANRVSCFLGANGPSITVDSACSSSLTALHIAVRAIEAGDCEIAIVGGVNVLSSRSISVALREGGFLSPTIRSRPFDARADGYVRGEGCGVIVLQRSRSGARPVPYATVISSALNQNGRSASITAPNLGAQRALINGVLARAGVFPGEVGYVEAHGTGTPLGDPVEVEALADIFGSCADRRGDRPLPIGAVKANIGHLEAAAGILGLIKVALAFHYDYIPGQPGELMANPRLERFVDAVEILTCGKSWPRGRRRIAAISSFGFGGSNAHVLLSDQRARCELPGRMVACETQIFVISAHSSGALRRQLLAWKSWLTRVEGMSPQPLLYVCALVSLRYRQLFPFRFCRAVRSWVELLSEIRIELSRSASQETIASHRTVTAALAIGEHQAGHSLPSDLGVSLRRLHDYTKLAFRQFGVIFVDAQPNYHPPGEQRSTGETAPSDERSQQVSDLVVLAVSARVEARETQNAVRHWLPARSLLEALEAVPKVAAALIQRGLLPVWDLNTADGGDLSDGRLLPRYVLEPGSFSTDPSKATKDSEVTDELAARAIFSGSSHAAPAGAAPPSFSPWQQQGRSGL